MSATNRQPRVRNWPEPLAISRRSKLLVANGTIGPEKHMELAIDEFAFVFRVLLCFSVAATNSLKFLDPGQFDSLESVAQGIAFPPEHRVGACNMRKHSSWGAFALTILALSIRSWAADPPKQNGLTKSQQAVVDEQVIPAWQQDSPLAVLQSLSPVIAKMDDARIEMLDRYLEDQGIPTSGELLANSRLVLVEQNLALALPKPEPRELVLALKALIAKIEREMSECGKHATLTGVVVPQKSLKEYEQLFWDLHVLDNRLLTTTRIAGYADQLSAAVQKLSKKNFSDGQAKVAATDITQLKKALNQLRQKLATRDFEYRVARLQLAHQVLKSSPDLKQKFVAAYVIDLDGERLATQLKIPNLAAVLPDKSEKREKSDPAPAKAGAATAAAVEEFDPLLGMADQRKSELAAQVRESLTYGRQLAGEEQLMKSRLLFTGLHWWYRGRYGAGSDGKGLLKTKLALASPQAMFSLYMPMQTPTPSDPTSSGKQSPQVDRRHHYLWQFETSAIQTTIKRGSNSLNSVADSNRRVTTFDRFF